MAMNLKSFFDLDKVVFTESELELPYEDSCFPRLKAKDFSYTSTPLPKYSREMKFAKINLETKRLSGVAA